MSEMRMVAMTAEQAAEIETYIERLMREHQNERAAQMMNLSLAWRFATQNEPELPSNVVALEDYSRRVPCA